MNSQFFHEYYVYESFEITISIACPEIEHTHCKLNAWKNVLKTHNMYLGLSVKFYKCVTNLAKKYSALYWVIWNIYSLWYPYKIYFEFTKENIFQIFPRFP